MRIANQSPRVSVDWRKISNGNGVEEDNDAAFYVRLAEGNHISINFRDCYCALGRGDAERSECSP